MDDPRTRSGNIVIGMMLVAMGLAVILHRAGVVVWDGRWTLWPVILIGLGVARFVQTPAGRPRQGLLLMLGGLWLAAGDAGWLSRTDSWPILVIAFGLIVAVNPRRRLASVSPREVADASAEGGNRPARPRRHEGALSPLAAIGVGIAILVAVQVSGIRGIGSSTAFDSSGGSHVVSVMGRAQRSSSGPFSGAGVTNVMGRSELDLRTATIRPGAEATVDVFSAMGAVVVRVPPGWTIDTRAVSALGNVRDERFAASRTETPAEAEPAPRLVLRGLILMGRLVIAS
jgi:hypothetical protein